MNDKTCGTCALSAPKYGIDGELVCLAGAFSTKPDDRCRVYEHGATNLCYRERTDSVEQVAKDMLEHIRLTEPFPSTEESGFFRGRLHALGVI